jgi:hypothetical protein
MREAIRRNYDPYLMHELFGEVNIPPQVIEVGMHEIQPGVRYSVASGFFARSKYPGAINDAAPFLYWLTHGTKFPARAHREWIQNIFMEDQIYNGTYCLSSTVPELDGKPVEMEILKETGVSIFDYRGARDPISPAGSCVSSILGEKNSCGPYEATRGGMNRIIEKNVGHIFVVSRDLLAEFLDMISAFFRDEYP